MKKFLFSLIAFLLLTVPALADIYIVSDTYPNTSNKPTTFVIVFKGVEYNTAATTLKANTDGTVYLCFNITGKWTLGTNTITAKAKNALGESAATSYTWEAAVNTAPVNVKLIGTTITCDSYTLGQNQPIYFVVTYNGVDTVVNATVGPTAVTFSYDFAGKYVGGKNSLTVKARNAWGDSPATTLDLTPYIPSAPTGIKIQ
jgi:hypothetical protein